MIPAAHLRRRVVGGVEGQSAGIEVDRLGAGPGVLTHRRAAISVRAQRYAGTRVEQAKLGRRCRVDTPRYDRWRNCYSEAWVVLAPV